MSSVVIAGNTSGSVTLAAPDVAGSTTLTLPATSGTVITSASTTVIPKGTPTFSAYPSGAQSIGTSSFTKLLCQTEEWDTNSNYDTSNSRFTPTVAGYYLVTGNIGMTSPVAGLLLSIYKNGARYKDGAQGGTAGAYSYEAIASGVVYCNGSTDYIELYGYQTSGGSVNTSVATPSTPFFQATMIRGA